MIISPITGKNLSVEANRSNTGTSALLWPAHRLIHRTFQSYCNIIRNYLFKLSLDFFTTSSLINFSTQFKKIMGIISSSVNSRTMTARIKIRPVNFLPALPIETYHTRQSFASQRGFGLVQNIMQNMELTLWMQSVCRRLISRLASGCSMFQKSYTYLLSFRFREVINTILTRTSLQPNTTLLYVLHRIVLNNPFSSKKSFLTFK